MCVWGWVDVCGGEWICVACVGMSILVCFDVCLRERMNVDVHGGCTDA